MSSRKTIFTTTCALALMAATSAVAQSEEAVTPLPEEVPSAEDFSQVWDGFYGVVHLDATTFTTDNADLNNQFNSNAPEQSAVLANGGVAVGYNWLLKDGFVLGAELDYTSTFTVEEFISSNVARTTGAEITNQLDGVFSIKARAGMQNGNMLSFVTGGIASASSKFETYQVDTGSGQISCETSTCAATSDSVLGVTIGAGVEYAFREDIIGRLEIQHYSFDDVAAPVLDAAGNAACASGATDLCSVVYSPSATSVKLGFVYKF